MTLERTYLALCVLGTVVPLSQILPWLMANGFNTSAFLNELFATRVSSFFAWDVIVSAVVVLVLAVGDVRLRPVQKVLVVGATLLVGVSCGLPLGLWLRSRADLGRVG